MTIKIDYDVVRRIEASNGTLLIETSQSPQVFTEVTTGPANVNPGYDARQALNDLLHSLHAYDALLEEHPMFSVGSRYVGVCPSCHRLGLHVEGCCFCDSEQGFTHDDGCDAEDAEGDTPEKEDSAPIELSEVAQMFLRCAQPAVIEALCADECLPGVCLNGQIITDVLCEMDDDQLAELLLRSCAPGIDKDLLLGEVDSSEQFDAMCKACDPKTKVEGVSKCVAGWLVWADLELGSVSNEDLQQCFLRWAPLGTEFPDALLES